MCDSAVPPEKGRLLRAELVYRPVFRPALWPARYAVGSWAFTLHRIAGVTIAVYGTAHIIVISLARQGEVFDRVMRLFQTPPFLVADLLLIAAILYHGLNGFRIILFDLGIGIGAQKRLFWGLMALGVILFLVLAGVAVPYILGRPLG